MNENTHGGMENALQAITTMTDRSRQARAKFAAGTSQHTLLQNRIHALHVAHTLLLNKAAGEGSPSQFTAEELERASAPLASLISKSEKTQAKLAPGTWQHTMLAGNLQALYMAAPLLDSARKEQQAEGGTEHG